MLKSAWHLADHMGEAPVLLLACAPGNPERVGASVFPAVQNLLLSAGAVGLGSALTTLAVIDRDGISKLLALPGHIVPMAIVPLGWPSRTLGPPRREPVEEKTHREVFGSPW